MRIHGFVEMVSPDAMSAAASHVEREYGYGYRIGIVRGWLGGGMFAVRHGDGSEFVICADRWGNVHRVCEADECTDTAEYRGGDYLCDSHATKVSA